MNDVDSIHWKKLKRFIGETKPQHEDRAYKHEEILTMVNGAGNPKMRAIILLMASSGIRIGSIPNLKVSHLERKGDLYKISVYEGLKGNGHYWTLCTPEAARELDQYLEFRKRCGEPVNNDSPLFRMDFDSKFHSEARNNVKPVTLVSVRTSLHRLLLQRYMNVLDAVLETLTNRR
jgi:integrase